MSPTPPSAFVSAGTDHPAGRPRLQPRLHGLAQAGLYVVTAASVDAISGFFGLLTHVAVPWNPVPAIGLAYVMLSRSALAPLVVMLATALLGMLGQAPGARLGAMVGAAATAGALYAALGLLLRARTSLVEGRLTIRDVSFTLLGASVAALLAAAAGLLGPASPGSYAAQDRWLPALFFSAIGDLLGIVVLLPLVILALRGRLAAAVQQHRPFVVGRDLAIFLVVMVGLLLLVFKLKPFDEFRMFYLLFLPMVAVATRYGLAGVSVTLPLVQVGLILSLAWFVVRSATVIEFQLLMLALSVTALYLGALADRHRDALLAVQRHEVTLREQQRALEQTLRAAAASEMSSALAHELNQPLSAIGTYARVCRMQLASPDFDRERLSETLEKVAREAARGGEFVRRMRDFFRTGSTRLEPCDVGAIVRASLDAVTDRANAAGIRLAWDPPRTPAVAFVDRLQVETILHNLLVNAVEALRDQPGPRRIDVRAFAAAGSVQVEVADSGPGISPELGEQLFTPLATTKPHGMGLGLAISRSLASALGGELWLSKEQPRTTFCLRLPDHAEA